MGFNQAQYDILKMLFGEDAAERYKAMTGEPEKPKVMHFEDREMSRPETAKVISHHELHEGKTTTEARPSVSFYAADLVSALVGKPDAMVTFMATKDTDGHYFYTVGLKVGGKVPEKIEDNDVVFPLAYLNIAIDIAAQVAEAREQQIIATLVPHAA